jgi:hypothetical protein
MLQREPTTMLEALDLVWGPLSVGVHYQPDHADPRLCTACLHERLGLAADLCAGIDQPTMLIAQRPEMLLDTRCLNDSLRWGTEAERAAGLRPLADALARVWGDHRVQRRAERWIALGTVRHVLPLALRAGKLEAHAVACEQAGTLTAVAAVANYAAIPAAYAADTTYVADTAYAAYAAARTGDAAAHPAAYAAAAAAYAAKATSSRRPLTVTVEVWVDAIERAERGEVCP